MSRNKSSFVHLHVHTEYSLLDGAIRTGHMLDKAKDLGMDAVTITDHGNMFGAVEFCDLAKKAGIKPIIGSELYLAPGDRRDRSQPKDGSPSSYHLVLLVINAEGYKNLSKLVTLGYLEGFYYRPRVDMEILKEYNRGLIALSACLKGTIPYNINADRMELAKELAVEMASIFDDGRFFLEVQANKMPAQTKVNAGLRQISDALSIPLVATNDCHYLDKSDAESHDVLLCIQTGKTVDDDKRLRFSSDEFYFKTQAEMRQALPGYDDAIENTGRVADLCNYEMDFGNYKYPKFHVDDNKSLDDLLTDNAISGLETRLSQKKSRQGALSEETVANYRDRLDFELQTLHQMGFAGYFLIVADFIEYARKNDIPVGPGRGSAAGSLVAFCLNITDIDPIEYGLLFERFLNPQRISMPDIDIDFCINGRDKVIKYVADKYGHDSVGQIITFGSMKARAVIRDVGRALNIPLKDVDRIAKLVPEGSGVSLEKAVKEEPELKKLEDKNASVQRLLRISRRLEGMTRHASTHASGVVISDRPLVEYLPLFKGSRGETMTQFSMDRVEQLGLIKFDFLGLKTLTVIKQALDLIYQTTKTEIDISQIPLDDKAVYRLCGEGRTTGVFQLESSGMKEYLKSLKPETFKDLVGMVALYRPGPLGSNMVNDFIKGKHGEIEINYFFPQLEPILKETYGVILYQEQVMKIAQTLADYSMGEADELRKAMGKKKIEVMAKHRDRFVTGAMKKGIKRRAADNLFSLIEKFGGYGFNKSHSAAYAMIAYQTAYLKVHYPVQYMAALLTQDMGNQDKTIKNIAECRSMGIEILPPDINESQSDFSVVAGKIRFGLAAIKNVGLKAVEIIIEERSAHGRFTNLLDFCNRVGSSKVNKRVLEGLIQCGALDSMGNYRSRLFVALDDIIRFCGANHDPNQLNMFVSFNEVGEVASDLFELPDIDEWDEKERLKREKDALGFYITGHPLSGYKKETEQATCAIQDLAGRDDKSRVKLAGVVEKLSIKRTRRGDKMGTVVFEDMSGSIEALFFPDIFNRFAYLLKGDDPLLLSGYIEKTDKSVKIIGQEIMTLEAVRQKSVKAVELIVKEDMISKDILEQLQEIVFRYPGDSKLVFRVHKLDGDDITIYANRRFNMVPCSDLIREIESVTGIENYRMILNNNQ
jgi:DNA polymerase-3 subunit alpha